ncbi:hypothetical protein [Microseira wollei]|uniref:hypothetical protein n=1 Tax=Microseira wollei TaxID=467598 RepID=UPI001CFDBD82|nr:hypothetical protein [Microseira wollei]
MYSIKSQTAIRRTREGRKLSPLSVILRMYATTIIAIAQYLRNRVSAFFIETRFLWVNVNPQDYGK